MKKLFLSVLLLTFATFSFAQNSAVSKANTYVQQGKMVKALEYIELATKHDKTARKAKTWFTRANVFMAIFESKDAAVQGLSKDPVAEILTSFAKVKEFDKEGGTYIAKVEVSIPGIQDALKDKLYRLLFTKGIEVQDKPKEAYVIFNQIAGFRPDDFGVVKNTAYFAMEAEMYDEAMKIYRGLADNPKYPKYIQTMKDAEEDETKKANFSPSDVYYSMIRIAKMPITALVEQKDALDSDNEDERKKMEELKAKIKEERKKQFVLIEEARKKYPEDKNFLLETINYYIQMEEPQNAVGMLNKAIELEPENITYYWNLGLLNQELGKEAESVKAYEKGLEVDAASFDCLYGLGALHFNKGATIRDGLSMKVYGNRNSPEMKEVIGHFTKSLPFMEKAYKGKAKDTRLIRILEIIYTDLDREEDVKRMKEAMKVLMGE